MGWYIKCFKRSERKLLLRKGVFMKNRLAVLGLVSLLLLSGMALSGCAEFMDGFVDGYQSARYGQYSSETDPLLNKEPSFLNGIDK
jgi:hypothetical protein